MKRVLSLFCLLAPVLAGCNLAPKYQVPLVATPVSYKEAQAWQKAQPADRMPRGAWWRDFGDPQLTALEERIGPANPSLQAALANYQRSRALVGEAQAGLQPNVGLGGQIYSERQSNRRPRRGGTQPNSYPDDLIDVQARYELDIWERIANQVRSSRDQAQAAAAEAANVQLSLQAELATDYVALRGLDAQADVLRRAVDLFGQAVITTRNRFEGKIAPLMDVTRADAQWEDAKAQLADVLARRALLEHAIAVLVGQPPGLFSLPPAPWVLRQPALAPDVPAALLQRRPDIAAAERQVAASYAMVGVARAAFYPALTLNLLYGFEATGINVFSLPNNFWAVGPGLAMPLLQGGLRDAELAAALAAADAATARYRQTVLAAFQDVEDQLSSLTLLAQAQQARDASFAAADRTLAMANALYKDGATGFLDVVVAESADLQARQAQVANRTRQVQAGIALVRALGGGWTRDALPGKPQIDADLQTGLQSHQP